MSGREDNIKMDFKVAGCDGVYWIYLAHDRGKWHAVVDR
jgi:hypothetical protein